jgi:RNA polymerase subunit RPABC4/transcription elongation factor Spt4
MLDKMIQKAIREAVVGAGKAVTGAIDGQRLVCGGCGNYIREDDHYCKHCGNSEKVQKWLYDQAPTPEDRARYYRQEEAEERRREQASENWENWKRIEKGRYTYLQTKNSSVCDTCDFIFFDQRAFCSDCGGGVRPITSEEVWEHVEREYDTTFSYEERQKIEGGIKPATPIRQQNSGCLWCLRFIGLMLLPFILYPLLKEMGLL